MSLSCPAMEISQASESSVTDHDRAPRLIDCEVCGKGESRYTCPKCGVKTCRLKCVNVHKKELECDGIRDKTKFVYTQKFTNLDLLSDYKLLEESSRFVYSKQKNADARFTSFNKELPLHLYRLKCAARKRGTILFYLLENFSRHRANTTRLNYKLGKIFWRIEWIFLNAHPNSVKYSDDKCDESSKLGTIMSKYFDPKCDAKESLCYYHSAGFIGSRVLLQAERIKSSNKKYHELDVRLSLKENLAGKCIIEFPIIYVMLKDHSYEFDVVNSDDELCNTEVLPDMNEMLNQEKPTNENVDETIEDKKYNKESFTVMYARQKNKQIESEIAECKKKGPKNFFFGGDYSSSDEAAKSD
ncbi:box C/D snoRNA protein 1 [Arctopsyche grandis]|uniref:box C/D snoRNA protein 1 n=1 Tax=Arctopsyche grandis TaxID=121162 RepID=UPI00406D7D82